MILNRLAETDKCPSCKVTLENDSYDITHRCGGAEGCASRSTCHKFNHHLVVPLLLLPVILLLLGIVRLVARPEQESLLYKSSEAFNGKHSLEEFEDRDLINDLKTSFVPFLTNALPLNVLPLTHQRRKRRCRRQLRDIVWGLHDAENISTSDIIVWAAVKPPFENRGRKSDNGDQGKEGERGNNEYDENYEPNAFQDDEQEMIEPKTDELLIKENKNNWESFWKGKIDEKSIRKAQAQMMLTLMNISVDPCEDFYEYACGGWANSHPIPKNRAGSGTFEILRSNIDTVVRRLLENDLDPDEVIESGNDDVKVDDRSKLSTIISVRENASHEEGGSTFPIKTFVNKMLSSARHLEMKQNNEKAFPPELITEISLMRLDKNDVTHYPHMGLSEIDNKATSSEEHKGIINGDFLSSIETETVEMAKPNDTSQVQGTSVLQGTNKKSIPVSTEPESLLNLRAGYYGGSQLLNTPKILSSMLNQQIFNKETFNTGVPEDVRKSVKRESTVEFVEVPVEAISSPVNSSHLDISLRKNNSVANGFDLHDGLLDSRSDEKNSVERVLVKSVSTEGRIDQGNSKITINISSSDSLGVSIDGKGTNRTTFKLISKPFRVTQQESNKTKYNDSKASDFDEVNDLQLMKENSNEGNSTQEEKSVNIDELEVVTFGQQKKQKRPNDATKKAQNLYKSCMNVDTIEKRAEKPLIKLLEELGGGWPKQTTMQDVPFDWTALAAKLRLYNNNILIAEWVGPDIRNSSEYVVQLDEAGLGLPTRDYFLSASNTESVKAYRQFIITIANLLGATIEDAEKVADQLVDFEIHLALITASHEEKKNLSELYHRMTVRELSEAVPGINWRQYLGPILGSLHPNFNMSSLDSTSVVVFALRYFRDLSSLLNKYPSRVVQSYMLWRFASHRAGNLDLRFWAARSQLRKALTGREEAPPRWESCVAHTTAALGHAVGSLFVKQHFDEQSKSDTLRMTTEIRTAFRKSILDPYGATASWMDVETRSLAVEKADAMALRVGYPDSILDPNLLDLRYADLKIDPELYFENTLAVLKYLTHREHSFLDTPVDKTQWSASPTEVNAFYSRNKNQILLPAGILQPPFYHRHFPRSLNYGGVGVVIGHEMTHGFDIRGRLFDRNGNLQRWWQPPAIEAFQQRAMCLVDQYNRYYVEEVSMQIDGIRTQGENIADNGGIKQAYKAYEDWLKKHGEGKADGVEESLPGLDASPRQLFFLNFAQVWCGALRPEAIRNQLKTSIHSLGKFRVIGTLSNSEDFSAAFSCPNGSPMNPEVKCSVW